MNGNDNNTYYEKYMKSKQLYFDLKNHCANSLQYKQNEQHGGKGNIRHSCDPTKKYSNICAPDDKGYYKSEGKCINDCETKYITHHLMKANIKGETIKFYLFIKDIIKKEKIDVYIKGGNVIGLYLLKMIYNKYKDDDVKFKKAFDEFLKLELMKDWDFAAYTKSDRGSHTRREITPDYRKKLDKMAKKYKLVPRAKTFVLYQTYKPMLIDNKALFEIAILDSDAYSTLELPMTTMKVKVHEYNLKYIYMFAKSFLAHELTGEDFDFDILKKMIKSINVVVHPHESGLYVPGKHFDNGGLSDDLIHFINTFTEGDSKLSQFLVIHLQDPYRLLYRFPEKNVPKTKKIIEFIKNELSGTSKKDMPSWLIDTIKLPKLAKSFAKALGEKIQETYDEWSIDDVERVLSGVKFGRTQIEYDNFSDESKDVLNLILKPLIDSMGQDQIKSLVSKERNDVIMFIKFLNGKLNSANNNESASNSDTDESSSN
jgi:hypothetical protein